MDIEISNNIQIQRILVTFRTVLWLGESLRRISAGSVSQALYCSSLPRHHLHFVPCFRFLSCDSVNLLLRCFLINPSAQRRGKDERCARCPAYSGKRCAPISCTPIIASTCASKRGGHRYLTIVGESQGGDAEW